jgi:hypothetical protein
MKSKRRTKNDCQSTTLVNHSKQKYLHGSEVTVVAWKFFIAWELVVRDSGLTLKCLKWSCQMKFLYL